MVCNNKLTMSQKAFSKMLILIVVGVIAIGGVFAYKYSYQPSKQITLSPQNQIANWKTYQNEEYGFEIKYPDSWYEKHYYPSDVVELQNIDGKLYISTGGPCSDCIAAEGVRIAISLKDNPQRVSLKDYLDWCYEDPTTCSCDHIIVSGINAVKITRLVDFGAGWPNIYIPKEDKLLVISYAKTAGTEDYLATLNQMLSTFRFLE